MHATKIKQMMPKSQNNLVVIVGFLCYNRGQTTCMTKQVLNKSHTLNCTVEHMCRMDKVSFFNHISSSKNSAVK